jgi:Tol biopolymer transport system component
VTRDGKSDVYISDASGKNEKRLTQVGTAIGEPQWSQDNRYILFDSYQEAETAKYVVSTNGKPAKKVTDIYLEGVGRGF